MVSWQMSRRWRRSSREGGAGAAGAGAPSARLEPAGEGASPLCLPVSCSSGACLASCGLFDCGEGSLVVAIGPGLRRLVVGLGSPARERPSRVRPVVSDRASGPQLCGKGSPRRRKAVKQVKSTVHVDRRRGGLRERLSLRPRGSLNYFYGACLLGFLWPIILISLVSSPHLMYLRILPCVCMRPLAKMDFTRDMGREHPLT